MPEEKPYDVLTKEEMESGHFDKDTIQALRDLKESQYTHKSKANIQESNGTVKEEKNMATIKEVAQAYVPQHTMNISELPEVNIELMQLEDREGTDAKGEPFKYKVTIVNEVEYRVPGSVIGAIKGILDKKPTLKRISVSKTGDGLNTRYTVIPIE